MAAKHWNILYRGPLSSCNYDCSYCPFAKTTNTAEELREDAHRLQRFTNWVDAQGADPERTISFLITPWGEAIIHRHYQQALHDLSHLPHVKRIAIQTNLSFKKLDWLAGCDLGSVALWTTYHPTQVDLEVFLERCLELHKMGVDFSVGVVGFKEALDEIRTLRERLPESVYLWVNAYKRDADYYSADDIAAFEQVDPLFRMNARYHPSRGLACRAGHSSFSVDGDGYARRCHFIDQPIGNIYIPGFEDGLKESPQACTNETCGCHIGYVHMAEPLDLYGVFGDGVMERIPRAADWQKKARDVMAQLS